jgi:hypothetical protein
MILGGAAMSAPDRHWTATCRPPPRRSNAVRANIAERGRAREQFVTPDALHASKQRRNRWSLAYGSGTMRHHAVLASALAL